MLNFTLDKQPATPPVNVTLTKSDDGSVRLWLLDVMVAVLYYGTGVLVMQHLRAADADRLKAAGLSIEGRELKVG